MFNIRVGNIDIDKMLLETEKELENSETKYLNHEDIFSKARKIIDSKR